VGAHAHNPGTTPAIGAKLALIEEEIYAAFGPAGASSAIGKLALAADSQLKALQQRVEIPQIRTPAHEQLMA
jgi:hypothetical protein